MGKRILVVDDEPTITELIDILLSGDGFDVSTASNGSRAIEMIDSFDPDLIITDITMPDMGGVEFILRLRKRSVGTPIIAMSGNAVGMNFLKAAELFGATETILKPFNSRELISVVKRSLGLE